MIKRIIFDLDGVLIIWKDEYKNAIKETLEQYHININYIEVDNLIEQYENYYDKYDINNFVELINKKFNLNIKKDFIETWLKKLGKMSEIDNDIIDTLEYLNKKYELVILTNWFKESQLERMKQAKIDKYFKEIYGAEEIMKPKKEAFIQAMGNKKIDECIMIGDNYKVDIEPPLKMGMKTIYVNQKNKEGVLTIKKVTELRNIL